MLSISLSERVRRLKSSPTLAVSQRAAELRAAGKDIIGLGAGEPDFDTPEHIKAAAIRAIQEGKTKYTAVDGTASLKQAIIEKFRRDNNLTYQHDQILVSCGGKQSFYNLCEAVLQAGDEAVIPAPYWVSYPEIVQLADATPVIVPAGIEQRFKILPAQLESAMTERTRLIVINSPSNPSGMVYSRSELEEFGEILRRFPRVLIATDDMYEHILWTKSPFVNIVMACPDLYDRTIVMNGVSKAYAMTGWRIGYAGGPQNLIRAMTRIQSQSTSNPASVSQAAAEAALNGDQDCIKVMRNAFHERHDFLQAALNRLPGVRCLPGDGTFYAFADFNGAIKRLGVRDDVELAEQLLQTSGVALVPGSAFGCIGYLRFSFATSMKNLENAITRLAAALSE